MSAGRQGTPSARGGALAVEARAPAAPAGAGSPGQLLRQVSRSSERARSAPLPEDPIIRAATAAEAPALHRLITANLEVGHLLPRALPELTFHAPRFFVAIRHDKVVGCGELAPLSHRVAEIRSLVVDEQLRGDGVGTRLVCELTRRARRDGVQTLCVFTHDPVPFVRLGFSIVPHAWLPEKIATDCHACRSFRRCGQYAMVIRP